MERLESYFDLPSWLPQTKSGQKILFKTLAGWSLVFVLFSCVGLLGLCSLTSHQAYCRQHKNYTVHYAQGLIEDEPYLYHCIYTNKVTSEKIYKNYHSESKIPWNERYVKMVLKTILSVVLIPIVLVGLLFFYVLSVDYFFNKCHYSPQRSLCLGILSVLASPVLFVAALFIVLSLPFTISYHLIRNKYRNKRDHYEPIDGSANFYDKFTHECASKILSFEGINIVYAIIISLVIVSALLFFGTCINFTLLLDNNRIYCKRVDGYYVKYDEKYYDSKWLNYCKYYNLTDGEFSYELVYLHKSDVPIDQHYVNRIIHGPSIGLGIAAIIMFSLVGMLTPITIFFHKNIEQVNDVEEQHNSL